MSMKTLSYPLVVLWFLLAASFAWAGTFYVRTDGGTDQQCNGTTDAAYPGSGTSQNCAWSHPFYALDSSGAWKIQGGDTLTIYPGSYKMGYGAPNTAWCDSGGAFDCHLPPLPSGPDSSHPTRILGAGWNSGCSNPPELWGTERTYHIVDLTGTSNALISCLELTDHSSCVEFHSNPSVACERDTFPFGDWASAGIQASASSNVTLQHLDIHGFADRGVYAGGLSDWTVEDVRIAGNGMAGWDGDLPEGNDSNSGTLTFKRWVVEWNGCAETYPGKQPDHCWSQSGGGYGDGVGTAATGGHWIIEDSVFRYNTSDGLDLLYLGSDTTDTKVEIKRTIAMGNAGNPIKVAGSASIENSLVIADCGYFNQKSFGQEMLDHCRAGGNALALDLHRGSRIDVVNCTVVGQSDSLVEVECHPLSQCDGSERAYLQNNIFVGYGDFLQADWGDQTGFMWDPRGITSGGIDYNVIYNVKFDSGSCPFGVNDLCSDPLFVGNTLSNFDGHLQAASPAIDSGLAAGSIESPVPTDDLVGGSRPHGNGVDRGAYEYGAVPSSGFMASSDLWIRAVIQTQEKGSIEAVWKKGGEDTTAAGDRVIWGYFYASPTDVTWGSANNPDLYVKIWFDHGGRVDVNFFHVSVPDIDVYSDYSYDGIPDEHGICTMSRRYIRQYYENGTGHMDEQMEDGQPPSGYSPTGNPAGVSTINTLRIGAIINTQEKGSLEALWHQGGQDTTSSGDQVVWGYYYADPNDVTWGSENNPDLFVKIWFDHSGRVDVNFFHVSVPDIEVYSDLPSDGIYNQKSTTILTNRYVRHEF